MTIGIIGCGSLGTTILRALRLLHRDTDFIVSARSATRLTNIKVQYQYQCDVT